MGKVWPQFGKTVLQKLVYLLTTIYVVPTGYEHTLYTYGPFSAELASDVETVFTAFLRPSLSLDDSQKMF